MVRGHGSQLQKGQSGGEGFTVETHEKGTDKRRRWHYSAGENLCTCLWWEMNKNTNFVVFVYDAFGPSYEGDTIYILKSHTWPQNLTMQTYG